ncbi:MAG: PEP-CTERM sorting domain-containing protein [Verrucomicrobiota bacterium]
MKKSNVFVSLSAFVLFSSISTAQTDIILALDFESGTPTTNVDTDWTSFVPTETGGGSLASITVGAITFTQTADVGANDASSGATGFFGAVPLLAGGETFLQDGMASQPALGGYGTFEISGLDVGTEYLFQFVGDINFSGADTGGKLSRDLTMTINGTDSVDLWPGDDAPNGSNRLLAYSQAISYTPTTTDPIEVAFTANGAGNKYVSGLIVATIPEPSTYVLLAGLTVFSSIVLRRNRRK